MFLNNLKNFLAKNSVKKLLSDTKHIYSDGYIKKVGLIVDETEGLQKQNILDLLVKHNIDAKNITVLRFKKSINTTEKLSTDLFCYNDIDWFGNFKKASITDFIAQPFDMLINYFENEKTPLMHVALQSKAKFKVGFSSVDHRLNQIIIRSNPANYTIFVTELFKYLKILNKI